MLNSNNVDDGAENNDNVHDDIFMPELKHPMASLHARTRAHTHRHTDPKRPRYRHGRRRKMMAF